MTEQLTTDLFFDGDVLHGPTRLLVEGARVVSIEPHDGPAEHRLVSPGFIDLQMNGHGAVDCSRASVDELALLDSRLAASGTTGWLATVVTAPLDRLESSIDRISSAIESGAVPGCLGIHLEGPFLGSAPGAHRADWIIEPDIGWASGLPATVAMMTIGAESHLAPELVSVLVDKGIVVSIGHTRPSSAAFAAVVEAGASMVTHLFNSMSGVHHRDDGLALDALLDDRVAVGLICDTVHVSPAAVELAFRAKRGRGVVLVSDTVASESEWARARGVATIDGAPRLADGTLAGSSTELAGCVRLARRCGIDLPSVLRAATVNPAEVVGSTDRGRIREGADCDILVLDADLRPIREGCRLVFPRGNESHR